MATASGAAAARAALAGNPSDGYGGATLAVIVPEFGAEVHVRDSDAMQVDPPSRLVAATIARFARDHGAGRAGPVAASWTTNIPREVGLAGSSAIVIATLRALCALRGVELEPTAMAALALAIETDELGIAAGPQDRVAQAYGGLTFMDFAADRYESLDAALLPPLYVSFQEDAHGHSGGIHQPLRARFEAGDPIVRAAMKELAGFAWDARAALLAGDHGRFARCVDASFDVRQRIIELDPRHIAMVLRARSLGASANYTGSGGAIVGSCDDEGHRTAVLAGLRADGCGATALGIG